MTGFSGGINTTTPAQPAHPVLTLERWAIDAMDLWLVPPLMWQASEFIHRRTLSVYPGAPSPILPRARVT